MPIFHKPYIGFLIAGYVIAGLAYASTAIRSRHAHLLEQANRPYDTEQWRMLRWASAFAALSTWIVISIGLGTVLGLASCGIVWVLRSLL